MTMVTSGRAGAPAVERIRRVREAKANSAALVYLRTTAV